MSYERLTQKQEKFAQNLFSGMTQREAWIQAGYSHNYSLAGVDSHACNLANTVKIQSRIEELNNQAASDRVMSVQERKERLSEISRARLTDFVEAGADGSYINVGLESCNSAAIQAVESTTKYDDDGSGAAVITKLKLHDPVKAIAELNKMEHIYSEGERINQDTRIINIIVGDTEAKRMIEGIGSRLLENGSSKSEDD